MTYRLNFEALMEHLSQNPENETCYTWEIKRSNIGGRGIFATKPIKTGSLIFINNPLAIGPRGDHNRDNFCSVCFKISDSCVRCERCFFKLCTGDCKFATRHIKKCDLIVDNWKPKLNLMTKPQILTDLLIYLDCLLLSEQQTLMLTWLQNNNSNKCSTFEAELKSLMRNVIPEHHMKLITLYSSILKINSFRISGNSQRTPLTALYPLTSFLNHSCVPNTRSQFGDDYSMKIYASKDIEAGEEVLICYTGLLWCTPARRIQLYKTKNFWCKCARCCDATEMGTRLSALRCFDKECVGVLLPVAALDAGGEWRCDNCGHEAEPARVRALQAALGSLVGALNLDDHFQLESFVLERLAVLIPYSNHIFVDLRLRLAQKLGFVEDLKLSELSESRLALKENLCRGTLRTLAALGAGEAQLRGRLLYHLHAALAERARRCPALYEELKPEIESCIEQAYSILEGDVTAPPDLELRLRYLGPGCDRPHGERFFILDT